MHKRLIIFTAFFLLGKLAISQDPFFSQFYNSPVYLNPALAGCGQNNGRFAVATRLQWIRLTNPMQYISASVDKTFFNPTGDGTQLFSSGLLVNYFNEGYLKNTTISVPLAKNWGGNTGEDCRDVFFSLALQPGITAGSVDRDKFLFIDQLGNTGPTGNPSGVDAFQNSGRFYFTMGAGGLVCYKNSMLGLSVHNLNEPSNGIIGSPEISKLPRRFSAHASHIFTNGIAQLKPTVIYQQQGNSKMFSLGTLIDWPESRFALSVWYRDNWRAQNNSFTIGGVLKLGSRNKLGNGNTQHVSSMGISYDIEATSPSVRKSYGSAEMGFITDFNSSANIECPRITGICNVKYPWEFF